MTPVHCLVSHDPENGKYGDCVRACVASLLDMTAESVPHFYDNGVDAVTGQQHLIDWLLTQGYAPFFLGYDGRYPLSEILEMMGENNPSSHYILCGTASGADHAVICKGGAIVYNPSWIQNAITGPTVTGFWQIVVIGRA